MISNHTEIDRDTYGPFIASPERSLELPGHCTPLTPDLSSADPCLTSLFPPGPAVVLHAPTSALCLLPQRGDDTASWHIPSHVSMEPEAWRHPRPAGGLAKLFNPSEHHWSHLSKWVKEHLLYKVLMMMK